MPLKLKRKLSYKGHYLYDYVSPQKLTNALTWLKANNTLYADVDIADDWVESATADDEELVMSMLEQPESMDHDSTEQSQQPECTDVVDSANLSSVVDPIDVSDMPYLPSGLLEANAYVHNVNNNNPVSHFTSLLKVFVKEHGYTIHDVPSDGNCLFSAVAYQLQSIGYNVDESSLREEVCEYLSCRGEFYSDFVHQAVASNDDYNADNEPLDEEDAYIESIADPVVQQELRYQKYVRRLSEGAWGDSIAISAMCNIFGVTIKVFCANAAGTSIAVNTPIDDVGKHELCIGLVLLHHFVGLDYINDESQSALPGQCGDSELDDETIAAGDQLRLEITGGIVRRGLPNRILYIVRGH